MGMRLFSGTSRHQGDQHQDYQPRESRGMIRVANPKVSAMSEDVIERRAQAIAEMQVQLQELNQAKAAIVELERDRSRGEDRIALLVEERDKYRREAGVFRTKLIELATSMANISMLTQTAEQVRAAAMAIAADETIEEAEAEIRSAAKAVKNLPKLNGHISGRPLDPQEAAIAAALAE